MSQTNAGYLNAGLATGDQSGTGGGYGIQTASGFNGGLLASTAPVGAPAANNAQGQVNSQAGTDNQPSQSIQQTMAGYEQGTPWSQSPITPGAANPQTAAQAAGVYTQATLGANSLQTPLNPSQAAYAANPPTINFLDEFANWIWPNNPLSGNPNAPPGPVGSILNEASSTIQNLGVAEETATWILVGGIALLIGVIAYKVYKGGISSVV
jgi:hypothetical protein